MMFIPVSSPLWKKDHIFSNLWFLREVVEIEGPGTGGTGSKDVDGDEDGTEHCWWSNEVEVSL